MSASLFLKSLAFGFILAATVGPMWVLCFRRTIASGSASPARRFSSISVSRRCSRRRRESSTMRPIA
jgi:hypothetical protein